MIKISNDITCTKPRMVAMTAYLEWLNNPTTEKNIFDSRIRNRWYSTIESTYSAINMLGPQIKFRLNKSCTENNSDKKMGAVTVVGRGIRKISLDNILKRSATI